MHVPELFSIRDLRKEYPSPSGPVVALNDVNVDIPQGISALVGKSGRGKTTLLNCVGGLDVPTAGTVSFLGRRLDYDDAAAMRRYLAGSVAWVFQELNLVPHQSVLENVALPQLCRGQPRAEALERAEALLDALEIADLKQKRPWQLSRGEKQRVSVCRSFCADVQCILADEPTASLDPASGHLVMRALRDCARELGKSVLLVTHDHELAEHYCDQVFLCEGGTVVACRRGSATLHSRRGPAWYATGARAKPANRLEKNS